MSRVRLSELAEADEGLEVDEPEFRRLMSEQRERAKADAAGKKTGNADISAFAQILDTSGRVVFTGYDEVAGDATVTGLLVNGASVPSAGAGAEVDVVLDRTPFYAEGGGQLADTGLITAAGSGAGDGARIEVLDVQAPVAGLVVHRSRVTAGEIVVGDEVHAEIDVATVIVRGGVVNGNIRAKTAIEVHAPGKIVGNLHSPSLFIDRGVEFQGSCRMDPLDGKAPPKPATKAQTSAPGA